MYLKNQNQSKNIRIIKLIIIIILWNLPMSLSY